MGLLGKLFKQKKYADISRLTEYAKGSVGNPNNRTYPILFDFLQEDKFWPKNEKIFFEGLYNILKRSIFDINFMPENAFRDLFDSYLKMDTKANLDSQNERMLRLSGMFAIFSECVRNDMNEIEAIATANAAMHFLALRTHLFLGYASRNILEFAFMQLPSNRKNQITEKTKEKIEKDTIDQKELYLLITTTLARMNSQKPDRISNIWSLVLLVPPPPYCNDPCIDIPFIEYPDVPDEFSEWRSRWNFHRDYFPENISILRNFIITDMSSNEFIYNPNRYSIVENAYQRIFGKENFSHKSKYVLLCLLEYPVDDYGCIYENIDYPIQDLVDHCCDVLDCEKKAVFDVLFS